MHEDIREFIRLGGHVSEKEHEKLKDAPVFIWNAYISCPIIQSQFTSHENVEHIWADKFF